MDGVTKALNLARRVHRGQTDKVGVDYIFHPVRVALFGRTEEEKIVGLLHDVVEDTATTLDDLRREGFSEEIVLAVDAITRREGEARADYLLRVKRNQLARAVKISDLKHNSDLSRFETPSARDIARTEQYLRETAYLQDESN